VSVNGESLKGLPGKLSTETIVSREGQRLASKIGIAFMVPGGVAGAAVAFFNTVRIEYTCGANKPSVITITHEECMMFVITQREYFVFSRFRKKKVFK
jgi:uncharacterized membrane protein YjjB (DUF3815 family)